MTATKDCVSIELELEHEGTYSDGVESEGREPVDDQRSSLHAHTKTTLETWSGGEQVSATNCDQAREGSNAKGRGNLAERQKPSSDAVNSCDPRATAELTVELVLATSVVKAAVAEPTRATMR